MLRSTNSVTPIRITKKQPKRSETFLKKRKELSYLTPNNKIHLKNIQTMIQNQDKYFLTNLTEKIKFLPMITNNNNEVSSDNLVPQNNEGLSSDLVQHN